MILSFPIDAWLLLFVAVGLGLSLEVVFYRRQRGRRGKSGVEGNSHGSTGDDA